MVQGREVRFVAEVECELIRIASSTQHEPFHERSDDRVRSVGDRHGHAGCLRDLPVLANEDVEDDPVDSVVPPVDRKCTDDVAGLSEPVDATFALFVPGRVPRKVVVDDGLEVLLQVDAFREAVGGHQHVPTRQRAQLVDSSRPLLRRQRSGHRHHTRGRLQRLRQVFGDVVRRVDESAEHDRVVAVRQKTLDLLDHGLQLSIRGRALESLGLQSQA